MNYKKILQFLPLFIIFALGNLTYAAEAPKTPITFIYVNGSNTNTERDKSNFSNGMKKIQISMKMDMESNDFVKKTLLDNGNLYISEKPKIFFWGYDSNQALSRVKEDLLTLKVLSPKMAQTVRTIIADVMHDAIWVQKEYNMQVIVNDLHKSVMASYNRGEKVILAGHSAGSFVTFRYLFHKAPAIKINGDMINNKAEIAFIKKHPVKPTCVDAITASGLGVFSTTGEFVLNQNPNLMKADYLKMNKYTDEECFPNGEVLGIVNFGSPIALFYSDNGGSSLAINQYNMDLYRYLIDNNLFFLTVNFNDDPIGFPLTKNLTNDEIENIYKIGFNQSGRGFFYSKSDVRSPSTFIGAHVSYWKYPDRFSKAVVKAYVDGYKNFYDL